MIALHTGSHEHMDTCTTTLMRTHHSSAHASQDKDFDAYVERLKTDGEWAGQVELIAAAQVTSPKTSARVRSDAAQSTPPPPPPLHPSLYSAARLQSREHARWQALGVHIVVHQYEHPSYRIECRADASGNGRAKAGATKPPPRDIHLSYHDGEHYNSVHPLNGRGSGGAGGSGISSSRGTRAGKDERGGKAEGGEVGSGEGDGDGDEGGSGVEDGEDTPAAADVAGVTAGMASVGVGEAPHDESLSSWPTGDSSRAAARSAWDSAGLVATWGDDA